MWNCSTVGTTWLTTNCSGCAHYALVVAGGGGGGGTSGIINTAGGGGAGGVLTGSFSGVGSFTVVVGAGGAGGLAQQVGANGAGSWIGGSLLTLNATGGGGGACALLNPGVGGSGGGVGGSFASNDVTIGAGIAGPPIQGYGGSRYGWRSTAYSPNFYAVRARHWLPRHACVWLTSALSILLPRVPAVVAPAHPATAVGVPPQPAPLAAALHRQAAQLAIPRRPAETAETGPRGHTPASLSMPAVAAARRSCLPSTVRTSLAAALACWAAAVLVLPSRTAAT